MNLIIDERPLNRHQERAILELTLKKQRSKKSTVSHKQVAAMQQLANELLTQRIDPGHWPQTSPHFQEVNNTQSIRPVLCRCQSIDGDHNTSLAGSDHHQKEQPKEEQETPSSSTTSSTSPSSSEKSEETDTTITSSTTLIVNPAPPPPPPPVTRIKRQHATRGGHELQRQSSTSTIATTSTSSTSSIVSASSSCLASVASTSNSHSSASSSSHHHHHHHKITSSSSFLSTTTSNTTNSSANSSHILSNATNIKLSQMRLEQLNNELERRLHQYEYLVAQEKAILGAYNINLFTNESVNNFHLFRLDQKTQNNNFNQSNLFL